MAAAEALPHLVMRPYQISDLCPLRSSTKSVRSRRGRTHATVTSNPPPFMPTALSDYPLLIICSCTAVQSQYNAMQCNAMQHFIIVAISGSGFNGLQPKRSTRHDSSRDDGVPLQAPAPEASKPTPRDAASAETTLSCPQETQSSLGSLHVTGHVPTISEGDYLLLHPRLFHHEIISSTPPVSIPPKLPLNKAVNLSHWKSAMPLKNAAQNTHSIPYIYRTEYCVRVAGRSRWAHIYHPFRHSGRICSRTQATKQYIDSTPHLLHTCCYHFFLSHHYHVILLASPLII